jgi:hypothetical protein
LNLSPDALSAVDELKLAQATALRLQLDWFETEQRAGRSIDVADMVKASTELAAMLPGPASAAADGDTGARDRIFAQLEQIAARRRALEGFIPPSVSELESLRAQVATLQAENASLRSSAPSNVVAHPSAPSAEERERVRQETNAQRRPDAWGPGPREEWRDHVSPDGFVAPGAGRGDWWGPV